MNEIIAATGSPQFNVLKKLEEKGYTIREVREGGDHAILRCSSRDAVFDATVTGQGQVTIPKEVRERLRVRAGGKVRFRLEDGDRVVMTPANRAQRPVRHPRQATTECHA